MQTILAPVITQSVMFDPDDQASVRWIPQNEERTDFPVSLPLRLASIQITADFPRPTPDLTLMVEESGGKLMRVSAPHWVVSAEVIHHLCDIVDRHLAKLGAPAISAAEREAMRHGQVLS